MNHEAPSSAALTPNLLRTLCVLIPVWKPLPELPGLVRSLLVAGFGLVVVVDDGSGAPFASLFAELQAMPLVKVLEHPRNLGKGRALKSGLQFLQQNAQEIVGVVTADGDGQHLSEDIVRVGLQLAQSGSRSVLGVRTFNAKAPTRNRLANQLTARVFRWLTGCNISDTQTGLRGLPRASWSALIAVPGERYEYETSMLVALCRTGQTPLQVPIETVYKNGNRSTHFRLLPDSLRVYRALFQAAVARRGTRPVSRT